MTNIKIIILSVLSSLTLSCVDSPTSNGEITAMDYYSQIFTTDTLDLNNDGVNDLYWKKVNVGNGISMDEILSVGPLNNAQLRYDSTVGNPIFYVGDTIKFESSSHLYWNTYSSDLCAWRRDSNYWHGNWAGKTAYLGVKIYFNNSHHCGYVNLTVDTLKNKIEFNFSDYNSEPNKDFIIK